MSGPRRPRWATPEDNAALIELTRACPMEGAVRLYFDRAPDFFTHSRLQGARVCVVDAPEPGELAASAAVGLLDAVFVDGTPREVFYAGDLRVRAKQRGGRQLKRLYDFLTDYGVGEGWELGITGVMRSNGRMAGVLAGKGGLLPYHYVATMRNFTVQFLAPRRRVPGVEVRPASLADVPAMVAFWNELQATKQFAPVWDEALLSAGPAVALGLGVERHLLAFRGDRLVGLVATWDQRAFKRMVVLGYAGAMTRMRRWYNPLARLTGLTPIPRVGEPMPYFYATRLAARSSADLEALLVEVYQRHYRRGYLFFNVMLDVQDPLIAALSGFTTQQVDIDVYAMDPLKRWGGHAFGLRPAYFDPALV